MALSKVVKIQLVSSLTHKQSILELLQNEGVVEIDMSEKTGEKFSNISTLQNVELNHANLEFAIKVLSNYSKKKSIFTQPETLSVEDVAATVNSIDWESQLKEFNKVEEKRTKAKNQVMAHENELEFLVNWKSLDISLSNLNGTVNSSIAIGSISTLSFEEFSERLTELGEDCHLSIVGKNKKNTHFYLIYDVDLHSKVSLILSEFKYQTAVFPEYDGTVKNYINELKTDTVKQNKIIKECDSELTKLAKKIEELKVVYEYFTWELGKLEVEKNLNDTQYSFSLTGWIAENKLAKLQDKLNAVTNEWCLNELELEEGERPPVVMENKGFIYPFEAVSRLYGIPKSTEVDPTPFLAAFFIVFFALALTDAGYGLIMFFLMAAVLRMFKLEEGMKRLVRLMMYSGVATFVIGALFGGWWGFTPLEVPEFLTYTSASGEQLFLLQKINPITNPLTVLMITFILGYIQILFGLAMKMGLNFRDGNKKEAWLDNGSWIFMLLGWGVLATGMGIGSEVVSTVAKWWLILAAILLVLTQGRDQEKPLGKLLFGVVSLYGLVGYMSDVLSYSRLLALGLATSIIGMTVNIIADLFSGIPYVGWLLMIIIFIVGHIFNLLINTFGAFIHAGRLQFVEFFTKFLEGGGRELKPLNKKTKYIFLNNKNKK